MAKNILETFHPDLVISFGGNVGLPFGVVAKFLGLKVIAHEQTSVLGISNRILMNLMGTRAAISWPNTFHAPKSADLVGNPVRPEFISKENQVPSWYHNPHQKKLIYVTGGNQGSKIINEEIFKSVPVLSKEYVIVHQTGSARNLEDYKKAQQSALDLDDSLKSNYIFSPWYQPQEVAWLFKNAFRVISRAGANTCTELLLSNSKAILIPLEKSGGDEQLRNAQLLSKLGVALVLPQSKINELKNYLELPFSTLQNDEFDLKKLHSQAAQKLADLVIKCLDN